MRECIDEGVLQSYVDGELSREMAERVEAHASGCSTCAEALDEATNEMAMFAAAFDAEMALDVPTVRLRASLDRAIAEMNAPVEIQERKQGWSFSGWFASFTELFKVSPQRAIGFASLVAVVAFAAIFATIYLRRAGNNGSNANSTIAINKPNAPITNATATPSPTSKQNGTNDEPDKGGPNDNQNNRKAPKKQTKPVLVPEPNQLPQVDLASYKPLPGEQNYLKAIDSLTSEIQGSDAATMKPSLRAEYERNLAVVNQAIDSTRRVARRNPNDPDAVQFLYSSYQSKLDLLSAVAEQVRPTIATR
ncbi:MAG TPA: zf-HC2 domain-containing protein [Pyrinomonadaceae bacterium]|nr:zf-HC2 domain-containing protein [Pyrinomonadaceae bacterium]